MSIKSLTSADQTILTKAISEATLYNLIEIQDIYRNKLVVAMHTDSATVDAAYYDYILDTIANIAVLRYPNEIAERAGIVLPK